MFDREEKTIRLPDLMKSIPFPIRLNPYTRFVSADSDASILESSNLKKEQRSKFIGLNSGLLCGMCYSECGFEELRACTDFMSFLFNLDDWSDEFDTEGTKGLEEAVMNTLRYPETFRSDTVAARVTKSWWMKMLETIGPNSKKRFVDTMDLYFKAITQQAADRAAMRVPELAAYIHLRRRTSGCKTGFVLIGYTAHIDLPDEVYEHPLIQGLMDITNDSISWCNDIFSYYRERSLGDPHNLVCVLMKAFDLEQQAAIDYAADMVIKTIERFLAIKAELPSWGPEVDALVEVYVQGLEDWIGANAEWSFMTERYFGKDAPRVRKSLQIKLSPVVSFK
ncbi:terpenoid synthase [Laetiporus sulphureus 93-53]|uniref:Terpene synthase n=1 Tax=Laetiporus sulphureus 93-53 TaxID=1314785 RepID=A0A165DEX2_9APHY|nr:terpenoid synthase [Laetiporus sulphureus 93-53]KZT04738.1 terpenoid synthase [Laetiporus sulphureus 93-53]